jgi:hypothetical protein
MYPRRRYTPALAAAIDDLIARLHEYAKKRELASRQRDRTPVDADRDIAEIGVETAAYETIGPRFRNMWRSPAQHGFQPGSTSEGFRGFAT